MLPTAALPPPSFDFLSSSPPSELREDIQAQDGGQAQAMDLVPARTGGQREVCLRHTGQRYDIYK